jgi:hypothetical protein
MIVPARIRRRAILIVLAPLAALLLLLKALATRPATTRRRALRKRPRLLYGPTPIITIKYMSRAMRSIGYEASTVVNDLYGINTAADFDYHVRDFPGDDQPTSPLIRLLSLIDPDYGVFAWSLRAFDVYNYFFDGGLLARTPLRSMEVLLLRLAGKKVVVMPYGSDAAVPSRIRSLAWRDGLMRNYPELGRHEKRTVRRLEHLSRWADYIVACIVHAETLPRWDLLTTHYYPIDADHWSPQSDTSQHDGHTGPVVVVHAPNHRGLKGTRFLVEACAELRDEGLDVDLRLLEGVSNETVHQEMARADIVAEQFLLGYALTAMEGMSLGKPVMSNLAEDGYYDVHRHSTGLDECPIVSTRPNEIRDRLRGLVQDPALRRSLGEAGRAYVLKYPSYSAMARLWDAIYRRIWLDEAIDPRDFLPGAHSQP